MKKGVSLLTLICLIAGFLFGSLFPETAGKISFLGDLYITILKFMIAPVIFTSIFSSAYLSKDRGDHLVRRAVLLFIVTFLSSFFLSSLITLILDPSSGFRFENNSWNGSTASIGIAGIFLNLFPKDLFSIFQGKYLFFVIVLSFGLGKLFQVLKLEKASSYLIKGRDLIMKVLSGFMVVTPLAVFALMANTAASYQGTLFMGLRYILSAYISGLLVLIIIMILPVTLFCGISPPEYIRKVYKIWLLTISTCSSAATLPHTLRLCKEDLGLDERLCDSVIPLGCTIHMCGGAVSFSLLGIFCAKLYGVEITFSLYLMMVLSSLILNMSAPGIPNGGVVIGATYLEMLGIPLGFIGFYSGIYKILDMLYTSLNVTGDITAALLLSGRRK